MTYLLLTSKHCIRVELLLEAALPYSVFFPKWREALRFKVKAKVFVPQVTKWGIPDYLRYHLKTK